MVIWIWLSPALFTRMQGEQCLEWVPIENGNLVGNRSLTGDNVRFAARLQKDGNDLVGYRLKNHGCLSMDEGGKINTFYDGQPCQWLRIHDGCTVYYMDYELNTALPPNAVIGGYTSEGLPVYVGRHRNPGYYIPTDLFLAMTFSLKMLKFWW